MDATTITFEKAGYVPKPYSTRELEQVNVVRLLEDRMIGYSEKLRYHQGDIARFYVHSSRSFRAELMRRGLNVFVAADLGEHEPILQRVPDGKLVHVGLSWECPLEVTLSEQMRPGLWGLRLHDGCDCYEIAFILASRAGKKSARSSERKRVLVLASDPTWVSYNCWGGRSRYRNFEDEAAGKQGPAKRLTTKSLKLLKRLLRRMLPRRAMPFARKFARGIGAGGLTVCDNPNHWWFRKLSVRRPFPHCSIVETDVLSPFASHLAAGEWRVLAWLEREGFDYDFTSCFDLHQDPDLLLHYDAAVLSTHCEYWTKEMFVGLKRFVAQGGWLLNLGGNSVYREIEFDDDGGQRCVSESFDASAEDESALLGVRYDERGYGTCAPYRALRTKHWAFDSTGLREGDCFATDSLSRDTDEPNDSHDGKLPGMGTQGHLHGRGGSGWETDKLSGTAPKNTVLLAKGKNPDSGGADMIAYETSTGGGVFSASSVTFGGCLLIDPVSSRIVRNVLRRATDGQVA